MKEQLQIVHSYLRMMWLHRWVALSAATIVAFAGWFFVLMLPNQFEVTAQIFIDTRSVLRPLLKGLVVADSVVEDSALLMRRTLLTRPNLEQVARRTDLDLNVQTPEDFDQLLVKLAESIIISGTTKDNIYQISYTESNPKLAKKVVDELLNSFFESTLGDSRQDRSMAQKFLDEQIAEYEKRLIEGEERLKEFKQKNMGMMPGTGQDYFARLETAKGQLAQAELDLTEASQRRDEIQRQFEELKPGGASATNDEGLFAMGGTTLSPTASSSSTGTAEQPTSPEIAQLEARIQGMEAKLDELLLNYTEKHPDVIMLRETMKKLEEKKKEMIAALPPPAPAVAVDVPGAGPGGNPVAQQLSLNLTEAGANVAALETRVKEYATRVEKLQGMVTTVPEVEAEFKRLDRDYAMNKQQYEELVSRRESARMSQQAEQSQSDLQLKVIEPPRLPVTPVGPQRLMFVSVVFLAALAVGIAIAFIMSQINPRLFTREELQQLTGLPILGAVSFVTNRWRKSEQRMEYAFFSLVFLVLVGFYAGLATLHLKNVDVHGYLTRLIGEMA